MKKVRLFVCADMTVIDIGQNPTPNFRSFAYNTVTANVTNITERKYPGYDGSVQTSYEVTTDYTNPYRSVCSKFTLTTDHFQKINWVE